LKNFSPTTERKLKQVMSLFTLGSARAVLVVALVYSFPMSLMWSWHWSPLTQTSLLLSPSDGLSSFLKTTLANGAKVVKKVITSKFRFHLIAIYALGCFRNFSCTPVPTKITLKRILIWRFTLNSFNQNKLWTNWTSNRALLYNKPSILYQWK
jgi:hypothetical protein